jgi:GAF domain-containing protein
MENTSSETQVITPEESTRQIYKRWREQFSIPLLVSMLVFGGIALIPALSTSKSAVIDAIFIALFIVTGIVTVVRFPYLARMGVVVLGVYVIGLSELAIHGILGDSLFFFLGLVVLSTMLLSPQVGLLSLGVNLLTFFFFGWLILSGRFIPLNPNAPPALLADWLSAAIAVIMFGTVVILGFQRLEKEFLTAQKQIDATLTSLKHERIDLEVVVSDRTRQLDKVNQIGRALAAILDPEALLKRAVQQIGADFEYYYIAFFMLDATGQWAELKEATGEAGRVLRENRHRLDINGKSMISKSIRTKKAYIAQDNSSEPVRLDNPLLPYTRSQIALPLIIGETVIGALEMHSTKTNAFSDQDVGTFQNMANGIAIALENSYLFHEAQKSLTEMRATQRQYLQGAWSTLTADQPLEYALGDDDVKNNKDIEVPLLLRDQIIGQIHLENTEEWTPEQRNLIESITTQATLALENARLVEESQSVAVHERLANELIAKIWSSTNMDNILQTTVRELGRTLDAAEVLIEVSMDEGNEH